MFCVLHVCSNFPSPVTNGTVLLISFNEFCSIFFCYVFFYILKSKLLSFLCQIFSKGN